MLKPTMNPFRGNGLIPEALFPRADVSAVQTLLAKCPKHAETPLHDHIALAARCGVARLFVKDESARMGLGSFKALGAAFAIADAAAKSAHEDWDTALKGTTYVAASAGNHGLSVAAGACVFGARAVIYLANSVPEAFADRLRAKGADVVRAGEIYEESMAAAEAAAEANGWQLLSDSTWDGYTDPALSVMEGYLQMAAECVRQMPDPPTHVLLQAGVGGLATALAAYFRSQWGDAPTILVVEPELAPALHHSIVAGELMTSDGPVSSMGRLDCKTPSVVALNGLSRDADGFLLIGEETVTEAVDEMARLGLATTPSGGAGIAALMAGVEAMPPDARVLTILSEGPEVG